jgi:hypothetical protein
MTVRDDDRWREQYERRMEAAEDRMDRHEVQCSERYKALADVLTAAGESRNEMRNEMRSDLAAIRQGGERNFRILMVAVILIAFAAVFQESTIVEFVKLAARVWTNAGAPSAAP